jgi:hypothetical protein
MKQLQGRRKLLKVGGAWFEGHFSNKKGHLKVFFPEMWRRGEGGHFQKFSGHIKKIFCDIAHFFLNITKFFRIYQKKFSGNIFFPEVKKIFQKKQKFKFSKVPFGQKMQS